jgi:hypothetical protein
MLTALLVGRKTNESVVMHMIRLQYPVYQRTIKCPNKDSVCDATLIGYILMLDQLSRLCRAGRWKMESKKKKISWLLTQQRFEPGGS